MKRAIFIGVFFLLFSQVSFGQWRRVHKFPTGISSICVVYDENTSEVKKIFVGTNHISDNLISDTINGAIWKWNKENNSWDRVLKAPLLFHAEFVDLCFKDTNIGWTTMMFGDGAALSTGCYRTIDGGETWTKLKSVFGQPGEDYNSLYYHKASRRLFLGVYWNNGLMSTDDGDSWQSLAGSNNSAFMSGPVFINDLEGIATMSENASNAFFYNTRDGGVTWNKLQFKLPTWQPTRLGKDIYLIRIYYSTYYATGFYSDSTKLYRSQDLGESWDSIHYFPYPGLVNGSMESDSTSLFVQGVNNNGGSLYQHFNGYYDGMMRSDDRGKSWFSICGPDCFKRTRFWADPKGIWAGDNFGFLWFNKTKKGAGPRLRIQNSNQNLTVSEKAIADVFYTDSVYYEPLDSISITMNISGEILGYESDSIADGWSVLGREVTDSTLRYRLLRTGSRSPVLNSFMLRVYFKTFVARDTIAQITLDEVDFNQDVTFRNCMVTALKITDTATFIMTDECGDLTLRNFLKSKPILEIISLHPNPTSKDITVDFTSLLEQEIPLQVLDDLGRVVFEEKFNANVGMNTRTVTLPSNWSGTFYLRLQMGKDVATGKFVKQ